MQPNSIPIDVVTIGDVAIKPISHAGDRVVTLDMIDRVHSRPEGTAGRAFRKHESRLIDGEDYFRRNTSEASALGIAAPNGLILVAETGYLMIVKTFRDDLAWEVQRKLVNGYFRTKVAASAVLNASDRKAVGGVVKAVIAKALAETRAEVAALTAKLEALTSPTRAHRTSVEYVPALAIVDSLGVPQKGRGPCVRRLSNAMTRWCRVESIAVREEAFTGRRLFPVDARDRFLDAGGREIVRQHLGRITGQSVIALPTPSLVPRPAG